MFLFTGTSAWLAYAWKMLLMASIPFHSIPFSGGGIWICAWMQCIDMILFYNVNTVNGMSICTTDIDIFAYFAVQLLRHNGTMNGFCFWFQFRTIKKSHTHTHTQLFPLPIGIKDGCSNISSTHFLHFWSPSPSRDVSKRSFECMNFFILFPFNSSTLSQLHTHTHIPFRELILPQSVR